MAILLCAYWKQHINPSMTKQRVLVENDALKEKVREMAIMILQLLIVAV